MKYDIRIAKVKGAIVSEYTVGGPNLHFSFLFR